MACARGFLVVLVEVGKRKLRVWGLVWFGSVLVRYNIGIVLVFFFAFCKTGSIRIDCYDSFSHGSTN